MTRTKQAAAHEYDDLFFDYVDRGALRSARVIVPLVVDALGCRSVLDVGCGTGAWLSVYRDCGVTDATGIDGTYVDRRRLMIPDESFRAIDLSHEVDLNRTFDLVQSLEVAEHLPREASRSLVSMLTRHGSVILFSAAVPGQGGEHHTNERPAEFWRKLFADFGYAAYDFVRPRVRERQGVEPWYAYNSMLYVRDDRARSLSDAVRRTKVPDVRPIANVAPFAFRFRSAVMRHFPVALVTRLAVLRHRLMLARERG
jgi:SAM-dependent methyltransferase